jgi:hypothetical protein
MVVGEEGRVLRALRLEAEEEVVLAALRRWMRRGGRLARRCFGRCCLWMMIVTAGAVVIGCVLGLAGAVERGREEAAGEREEEKDQPIAGLGV